MPLSFAVEHAGSPQALQHMTEHLLKSAPARVMDDERVMELFSVNSFPQVVGVVCVVALAGCAGSGSQFSESQKRHAAERQVQLNAMATRVLAQPLPSDTVLKLTPKFAMALIDVPAQGTEPATQARLFANCAELTLTMDYRAAQEWTSRYALPNDPAKAGAVAQQLCTVSQGGEWRKLSADGEDFLVLDPDSIKVANAQRWVWAGIDFERTRLGEDESYTYDRQLERVEIDCTARQASTRLAYRINDSALLTPPAQPLGSALSTDQRARLVGAVCAQPVALAQLPSLTPRKKRPPHIATPEVPAALLTQASAFPRGEPTSSLSHLQFTYSAHSPYMPSAAISDSPLDLYLQAGPAPGLWRVQTVGALGGDSVSIRWRGMIELASIGRIGRGDKLEQNKSPASINLTGDWKNVPAGSALSYSRASITDSGERFTVNVECLVGQPMPGGEQPASLKGKVRIVACIEREGLKSQTAYAYLEDYDLFIKVIDKSTLLVQTHTLKAAE